MLHLVTVEVYYTTVIYEQSGVANVCTAIIECAGIDVNVYKSTGRQFDMYITKLINAMPTHMYVVVCNGQ